MRILILSNFFPPARSGGYTQWCHEVAEGLASLGHTIGVLTSRYELAKAPPGERHVYRTLHLEGDLAYYQPLHFFTRRRRQLNENLKSLQEAITAFAPDVMFVWGMWALSKALPARAEQLLPGRVAYYVSDYWPAAVDMHTAYWQLPARRWFMKPAKQIMGKLVKALLAAEGQPALRFERVICVSARVRDLLVQAGAPVAHARVIHGGTDASRFPNGQQRACFPKSLELLYAGQLVEHKGVHTAIEAMARLVKDRAIDQVALTVVGSGHPEYEARLRQMVERAGLQRWVRFCQPVSRKEMPGLLQRFDVLVFPSIYEEPLARMTQEAMAAGLVVVGTTTGGTAEMLREGETGLTFAPGDTDGLADQITRLINEPDLGAQLAQAGRQLVLEHFTLDRMVAEIEAYLADSFARIGQE